MVAVAVFMGHWTKKVSRNVIVFAATVSLIGCGSSPKTGEIGPGEADPDPMTFDGEGGSVAGETPRWTPQAAEQAAAMSGGASASTAPKGRIPTDGWAIVLGTFSGPDHVAAAQNLLVQFQQVSGLDSGWIEAEGQGSILRYGHYRSFDTPEAQRDLQTIKSITVNGSQPFRTATLFPVSKPTALGRRPELHLLNARRQFPGERELYTLQIGVYDAEARQEAEEAAARLRALGEQAFYYHDDRYSMVTVGVFFADAVDTLTGLYSPEVRALRAKYPHNLFNGRTLEQKMTLEGGKTYDLKPQPSVLVVVPEK